MKSVSGHRESALLAVVLWAAQPAGAAAPPPSWRLPPLEGVLSGEFTPRLLPGAPPLRWKLALEAGRPRERSLKCEINGPGLQGRLAAILDPQGEGTWELSEVAIDLGEWFGWVANRFAPEVAGALVQGTMTVRGAGTWRNGALGGRAVLEIDGARYEESTRKLLLEGVAARCGFADLAARRSEPKQWLTWQSGRYDTIPFGAGRVEFSLEDDILRIGEATLAIFGGELKLGGLALSAALPAVVVTAQLRGIDLQQVLFLLPTALAAAQGRLDGQIALNVGSSGVQIGVGRLSLRQGERADLRLTPSPGLLSSQLPAAVQKHYPGLAVMETGGIPLRAELLEIALTPDGDAEGRTASVRIEGGPADPALRAPVALQVNVRGPLDSIIKFGTDSRLRFGDSR